jgi:acyl-CoA thioesterase
MDHRVIQAIFRQVEKEPFAQIFGLKLIDLDEGYSKVEMTFTPDMENIFGLAYGGALFALIDEAFETASNSHGTMAVAVNLNITYVASPEPASKLTAAAKEFSCSAKQQTMISRWSDSVSLLLTPWMLYGNPSCPMGGCCPAEWTCSS